jgi:hypothetical protein
MASRARGIRVPLCVLAASACVRSSHVERVFGGTLVEGRYIEAPAYAAFLRGSLADVAGETREAVNAYREAVRVDADVRTALTAKGAVRCRLEPCRSDPEVTPDRGPAGLLSATNDPVRAWAAVESWARAHDDAALRVAALEAVVRAGPARRAAAARAAEDLAGVGALGLAWSLAAAAVDASDEPLPAQWVLAPRLAVDGAIARGEPLRVRELATRGRLGLEEAAARAFLAGQLEVASSLALEETHADPDSASARLILAAAGGADAAELLTRPSTAARPLSATEWIAYGQALQHVGSAWAARAALAATAHRPLVGSDDRVVRAAVDLALRGVIDAGALPETGRVELAVIRDGPLRLSSQESTFDRSALDPRHVYLALAHYAPLDSRARELGERLGPFGVSDPIVAAAGALVDLARASKLEPGRARALLDYDPADPLLASVALRLAERTGESAVAEQARTVLASSPLRPLPAIRE